MIRIEVAKDFSETPGGRFPDDGDFSGQRFRVDFLVPALRSDNLVEVSLDGTEGFGSSFLEEAFGGLVRLEGFTHHDLSERLKIVANTARSERYRRKALGYIEKARPGEASER